MDERHEREVLDEATRGRVTRVAVHERDLPGPPGTDADRLELAVRALTELGMLLERRQGPGTASGLLGMGRTGRIPVVVTVLVHPGGYRLRAAFGAARGPGRGRRARAGQDAVELVASRLGRRG